LPVEWGEKDGVEWRTELPGRGWSSPVVAGGRVWMTTAMETEAGEEEKAERLKTNTGDQPLTLLSQVELRALCVDAASGKVLSNILLMTKRSPQWVHELNSYASPSPVLAGGRLYCHFGSLGTACVDTAKGEVAWVNEDKDLEVMHENGPGSTPVVEGGKVIFHLDGSDRQMVVALDAGSGKVAWKTMRSGEMN
jgi:outer membrane protein assembly factor BamB